ncbi:serine hydrolase domain-containing protein [Agromyces mangrovi Wang et al. 2018]|uniref:serine hydrolase domain-containing protein n=1 Tax=Agromyces mangrovi TaxID=1858653 RepID=UPI0025742179|nr:serine hydrolase [Agromyces mangrovi]BDZ63375.1 6-aminohexanoate-dimer hydrolase [Agromyces mangrovi]
MRAGRRVRSHAGAAALAVLVTTALAGCTGIIDAIAPNEQEVLAAEIRGRASQGLVDLAAQTRRAGQLRALVVTLDGEPILDETFGAAADDGWDTEEVTMSVISTLIGIAIADGSVSGVDATLAELLPDDVDRMSAATADATLDQVLTHTAGFAGTHEGPSYTFQRSDDWIATILEDAVRAPGRTFDYSDGGAHLLSAIIEQATGASAFDYARERLFAPLGIETLAAFEGPLADAEDDSAAVAWPVDPQGLNTGWSHLRLRPTDLAAIGNLYLQEGRWNDEQVVPASWVRDATADQLGGIPVRAGVTGGYGYLWWRTTFLDDPAYLAWGFGGQVVEVVPARGLVAVAATEIDAGDDADVGLLPSELLPLLEHLVSG